jgi:O-antigen/teichoic acid export membrane protein
MFLLLVVYSIILVPIFLKYWGEEKYGIWISIFAFVSLMRTIDLGHQNYIGNEFNRLYHQDKAKAIKLMGSSFRIAFLLGFIELSFFGAAIVTGIYLNLLGLDHELGDYNIRNGILAFLLMWWLVGSVGGIIFRLVLPLGKYAFTVYMAIIFKIGEILVLVLSAICNLDIFHICLSLAIFQFIYSLFVFHAIYKIIPDILSKWRAGNWRLGFTSLQKSLVLTLNGFLEQLNLNGTILLVSNFLSLAIVPVFTTIRTLSNTVTQLTNLITNPLQPELIRYHSVGEGRKIRQVIETNWLVSGIIVNIPFILLIPFVNWLYEVWTNSQLEFDLYLYYYLTLSVAAVNYGRSLYYYLVGINHLKAITIIALTRTLSIFGLAIPLVPYLGLSAVGLAVLIAEFLSSILLPLKYANRELLELGNKLSGLSIFLGGLPLLVLSIFYVVSIQAWLNIYILMMCTLMILSAIFYWQWIRIDQEVKKRLLSLINIRHWRF